MSFQVEITETAYRDLDQILSLAIRALCPTRPLDCRPSSTKLSPAWNRFHFPLGWLTRIRSPARS